VKESVQAVSNVKLGYRLLSKELSRPLDSFSSSRPNILYLKISTDIAVFIYNKQQDGKTEENLVTNVLCMETEPIIIQMNNKSPFIKENTELVKRKNMKKLK